MPLAPLAFPPGVVRPGTVYDARGRWYTADLVRWHEGAMQAWGGWEKMEDSAGADLDAVDPVRGLLAWRANDGSTRLAAGTYRRLYVLSQGTWTNVTLSGFTSGQVDASATGSGDYGDGDYGDGIYGTADASIANITEATSWQLDSYGEDLVGVSNADGRIWYFDTSAGTAAILSNAPTGCKGVVVTPERFVVALGAGSDVRRVEWADQDDNTDWTASATNQAGGINLPGTGAIVAGRRGRDETLIWTDTDLFTMRFIGGVLVYGFRQIGSNCGAVSRHSMAVVDGQALWMGSRGFFQYNGYVEPLESAVGDYVFSDFNSTQASKVAVDVRSDFGEVIWYYPSAGSTENDRYVAYNYRQEHWSVGNLERTAGAGRGAFPYPIATDASGKVYRHETGTSYLDPAGAALTPSAESGPVEIGNGDQVMWVRGLIPDENTLGDVDISLISALYPTATEATSGPFTAAEPTDVRIQARQVRVKVEQDQPGWRFGTLRLDVVAGGQR